MSEGVWIVCYTNSAVNDLRRLGFQNVVKLVPEKVKTTAQWIDAGLKEVIVVKRFNEIDLLSQVDKKKLHLVIDYFTDRFPENRARELQLEISHREKNYKINMDKKKIASQVWEDDSEIIEEKETKE